MAEFAPENLHNHLVERAPRILRFDPEAYFPEWQSAVRRSFKQLLGLMPARVPLDLQIISDGPCAEPVPHRRVRFHFTAEPHAQVPCTLLIPDGKPAPHPLIICLQGHGPGAYWSLGEVKNAADQIARDQGQAFALQALQQGYAALAPEMRCFGERKDQRPLSVHDGYPHGCQQASMVALLLGRTMIGERVWDVVRALDLMAESFREIDSQRIAVMGFSGGSVAAYHAAAYDSRIAAVIAASSVCTLQASIVAINHCPDIYIPNFMHYFDNADIAGLIVPRPLVIVTGENDPIFPLAGVRECYAEIAEIYRLQDAGAACRLVVGPEAHRPYPDLMWPAFRQIAGWNA
jgi:dienelactone hydrolase